VQTARGCRCTAHFSQLSSQAHFASLNQHTPPVEEAGRGLGIWRGTCVISINSMATNSFDYAFEDIDLVRKAVHALCKVAATTVEHQQAIQDLQLLESVLCGIQRLSPAISSAGTRRNIHYCGHFCRPPLDQFLRRLKELESDPDRVSTHERSASGVGPVLECPVNLVKEVATLQKSIGNGLRAIKVLLWVEELGCNVATNTFLPRELQQTIEALQGSLSGSNGRHYGRGHDYNNTHVSGSGRNHFGDNYYGDPTLVASLDGFSRRLDEMASARQVDRLMSQVRTPRPLRDLRFPLSIHTRLSSHATISIPSHHL
jgi:hypothetical protein